MASFRETVELIRLRHILAALGALHRSTDREESVFRGTVAAGRYERSNGSGDEHLIVWDESGLLAVERHHDDPEGPMDPREMLAAVEGLERLVELAAAWSRDGITAARWTTRAGGTGRSGLARELHAYEGEPVSQCDVSDESSWAWLSGVAPRHAPLALDLLRTDGAEPRVIAPREEEMLLAEDPELGRPRPEHVAAAASRLADVGIEWIDAVAHAEASARARPKGGSDPLALVLAAARGDVATVRKLASAGADLERSVKRTDVRGADRAVMFGDTALTAATRGRHADAVEALLQAGANPNAAVGPSALVQAAQAGDGRIVDLLLRHGADVKGPSVPRAAIIGRNMEVLRSLLAAGMMPASVGVREALIRIAEEQGAMEVAALLRA